MEKLTMTCRDVYYAMRKAGIRSSPERIAAGIESGYYPFGKVVNVGETGRRTIEIYSVDFYAWLESKKPKPAQEGIHTAPLQLLRHTM